MYIDITNLALHPRSMPSTRMDELFALAEKQDGRFTSREARSLGIQDSVLGRLRQRGRLESLSRGDYRIAHSPTEGLAQYREAILWAQASNGPRCISLSHETALLLHGISDANPSGVNLTIPVSARMRRVRPKWITIHQANLATEDIQLQEGMPVPTVERSILDVLVWMFWSGCSGNHSPDGPCTQGHHRCSLKRAAHSDPGERTSAAH